MSWKLREAKLSPGGRLEEYYIDDATGQVLEVVTDSLDDILDHNGHLRNAGDGGWSSARGFKRIGEIPLALATKWKREEGLDVNNQDHTKDVLKRLRDPDWSKLRTS